MSGGEVGGYSGVGGMEEKIRRLCKDSVIIKKRRVVNFARCLFNKL